MAMQTSSSPALVSLTPDIVAAQGKNDREYLALRVQLVLEALEKHPQIPVEQLVKITGTEACGQGCCCCCSIPLPVIESGPEIRR